MRRFFINALLLTFLLYLGGSVFAHRSGCHRWHSCPSDSGSYTCGDLGYPCRYGTWPESSNYIFVPPTPTPIIIPTSIQGGTTYKYNNSTKSYDVTFDWDDWNQSSGWSIDISQYAGGDPGPNMDTTSSAWTFKNVYPGTHYVNIKASVNNYWSRVSYWTINVPALPTPTSTPTNTPTPTITLTPSPTKIVKQNTKTNKKQIIKKKTFWQWLFGK